MEDIYGVRMFRGCGNVWECGMCSPKSHKKNKKIRDVGSAWIIRDVIKSWTAFQKLDSHNAEWHLSHWCFCWTIIQFILASFSVLTNWLQLREMQLSFTQFPLVLAAYRLPGKKQTRYEKEKTATGSRWAQLPPVEYPPKRPTDLKG